MIINNLLEYSNHYSKTEDLLQYYKYEPTLDNNDDIADFFSNNAKYLFKFKAETKRKYPV